MVRINTYSTERAGIVMMLFEKEMFQFLIVDKR